MRDLILEALTEQGVDYQLVDDSEEVRLPCPQCPLEKSRKFKLYFNTSKLKGQCWVCKSGYSLGRLVYDFNLKDIKVKSVSRISPAFCAMMSLRETIAKKALSVKLPDRTPLKRVKKAYEYIIKRDVTPQMIKLFGLFVCKDDFDQFYDRVIIPIKNREGRCCSYVGRDFTGELKPKYLFKKGTHVFDFMFGEDLIGDRKTVVIFEGTFSVMRTYRIFQDAFGKKLAPVASFSHHLSKNQERILQELGVDKILVFFDGDSEEISKKLCKRLSKWARVDYITLPVIDQPDDYSLEQLVEIVRSPFLDLQKSKIERISSGLEGL